MAVAARPGADRGRTMRRKDWRRVAPSIQAASSSSRGVASKNERINQTTSERLKVR